MFAPARSYLRAGSQSDICGVLFSLNDIDFIFGVAKSGLAARRYIRVEI